MYIIYSVVYPSHKAKEVAEKYIEMVAKYPTDENLTTEIIPAAVKRTEKGIKVITVAEVKPGKIEEALLYGENGMAMFNDIQGYEYSLDVYLTAEEALATLGMSMPE